MAHDVKCGYEWGVCESAQTQANVQSDLDRLIVQRIVNNTIGGNHQQWRVWITCNSTRSSFAHREPHTEAVEVFKRVRVVTGRETKDGRWEGLHSVEKWSPFWLGP